MLAFLKRTSFSGVSLNSTTRCGDSWKLAIREAVKVGIQQGDVRPLKKICVFPEGTDRGSSVSKPNNLKYLIFEYCTGDTYMA